MPRHVKRQSLGQLETALNRVNAERERLLNAIRLAVEQLTEGNAPQEVQGTRREQTSVRGGGTRRRRRRLTPAVRARLSQLAKARWAKAKKARKTRLG
jgi:hypothetical protein